MSFGQNLKNLRCAKLPPLTQTDLANAIGVTQRKISFLETGASEPSLRDIVAICRYFSVSADYLLGLPRDMEFPDQL
ncbi:MAG TPA: helix-turn-helix transcriptional regulator [Candidatus Fimenecus stercoravium]|nr:helix-turn-helix transcriptional regulator [Candidatus Fimenecus stercoravium]